MAHAGEPSGTLRDFSPWQSPRREDSDGTGDARRPARAEPGVQQLYRDSKYNRLRQRWMKKWLEASGTNRHVGNEATFEWLKRRFCLALTQFFLNLGVWVITTKTQRVSDGVTAQDYNNSMLLWWWSCLRTPCLSQIGTYFVIFKWTLNPLSANGARHQSLINCDRLDWPIYGALIHTINQPRSLEISVFLC